MTHVQPDELLEAADVARALSVTPAMVRVLARQGLLRVAARTPRGSRLFSRADVERLAARRREQARRRAEVPA